MSVYRKTVLHLKYVTVLRPFSIFRLSLIILTSTGIVFMRVKLSQNLATIVLMQLIDFLPYYLGGVFSLFMTHYIQSNLPVYAKRIADFAVSGVGTINLIDLGLMAIGIIIFRTSSRFLFFYPARVMQKNMRVEMLEYLERSFPERYTEYSAGQLFQHINNDMDNIRALIGFVMMQVGNIVIAMSVLIPKIMSYSTTLVWALIPMFMAFLLFTVIVSLNAKLYKEMQYRQGEVQNFIIESYIGKKTIKNFHAEKSFVDLFRGYSSTELSLFYKAGVRISFSKPLLPLGVGVSFLWGAYIIKASGLGVSSLILFSGFIFLFLEPLMFLSWIGVSFSRSLGAWDRIKKLIKLLDGESAREVKLRDINKNGSSDSYNIILWDSETSISVAKNKWTVFVGKTGHGKSEILYQIADVLKIKNEKMSFVAQTPYLYNDTLISNIFLGRDFSDKDRDEAYELLKLFVLDFLADDKDSLLDMEVGENGTRLSGGQAKRLCLVRTIMTDSNYIIWDDPFSSVDVILEKQIITKLKKLPRLNNRTIILSSHRVSTVRECDDVVYISKEGGMIANGPVEIELTDKRLVYEFFKTQMV